MTIWQHGELTFREGQQGIWHNEGGTKVPAPDRGNVVGSLNKLGEEGWQVVATSDGPQGARYVLSRPKPE